MVDIMDLEVMMAVMVVGPVYSSRRGCGGGGRGHGNQGGGYGSVGGRYDDYKE